MTIGVKEWVTHSLRKGDLTALAALGRRQLPDRDRVKRLLRRGFVAEGRRGLTVTPRGRLALAIRRFVTL